MKQMLALPLRVYASTLALAAAVLLPLLSERQVSAQGDGDWGTIKGRITWGGNKLPELAPIVLPQAALADCLKAGKGKPPPNETWVINKDNKGLKNIFVWLVDPKDPKGKNPLATHPGIKLKPKVEVDQPACQFMPHALALRDGQILVVKNSAPFAHNFKWTGGPFNPENSGNQLIPPDGSTEITLKADRLPILVECNIHPWMKGYIKVTNHPYFAVTDDNGAFEFKDAPAGDFRLMVWHPSGWKGGVKGKDGDPVTIKKGAATDLGGIAFPPPAP